MVIISGVPVFRIFTVISNSVIQMLPASPWTVVESVTVQDVKGTSD